MAETFVPNNLVAGETSIVTDNVTIASGEVLQRGAVLGKVSADGTYKLSLAAATDGSEIPYAILAEDVDASGAATDGVAYVKGEFNERALIFGIGHDAASVKAALRDVGIYTKSTVAR